MAQYSRVFVTLVQDRAGYGQRSREPSGRAIIEVKDGKGKVTLNVQELKGEIVYKAYIVSSTNGGLAVKMGSICADGRGKAELKWEFDPVDVEQMGIAIDEFDVVTVIVQSKAENAWVLTGYRKGEVRFKDDFYEGVRREKPAIEAQAISEPEPDEGLPDDEAISDNETTSDDETTFLPMGMFSDDELAEDEPVDDEFAKEGQVTEEPAGEGPATESPEEMSQPDVADGPTAGQPEPEPEKTLFKSMAKKFDKELEELENLILEEAGSETKFELDKIMKNNVAMSPYKTGFEEVKWVKIALRELTHLPCSCWKLMYDPYVNLMFNRYKHMMLGAYAGQQRYILALPDEHDPWRERHARKLGFDIFRTSDNIIGSQGSNYGYWLMEFDG